MTSIKNQFSTIKIYIMKKLITSLFVMLAVSLSIQAQVAWDQVKVSTTDTPGADTVYFNLSNRSTGQSLALIGTDSITSLPRVDTYAIGDSAVWRIIKGVSMGTTARIRMINVKTGQYLYLGVKGGTTKKPYMGPRIDPFNGTKDFLLYDRGPRVPAEYYYNIMDETGSILNNLTAGNIGIGTAGGDSRHMFRFNKKSGPQPKAALLPTPALELTALETELGAGSSVTLNAKVTKADNDLLGLALLYNGATVIDTLSLDANGQGSFVYSGLKYGIENFVLVYTGDANYEPADLKLSVNVGPSPNAKATKVELTLAATSEVHKDVPLSIAVKTSTDDIVSQGSVLVYVNGIAKNRVVLDVLGTGSVNFPNLLVGTENIKAVYFGDKMAYLDSDTARVTIDITPSTATVKPYPVYFDLCDQPEIAAYDRMLNRTATAARPYSKSFTTDSLPGITISDTINNTFKIKYSALGTTYDKIDNCYNRADIISAPLGSSRPTWIKFKTPWLNEGSYNVYISHRVSGDPKTNMSSVKMDDKELYFPNEEMYGRWFKSWSGSNTKRQWNAKAHSGNMAMNYIGSVKLDKSASHSLKITVVAENGAEYNMDMLQFIPVDMDSVKINTTAAVSMANKYYPMFDWTGFARQADFAAASVPATYADFTNFGIAHQVADQTDWGIKYSHTIDSVGLDSAIISGDKYVANYVTVYRAEDKWTRVSEGYSSDATFNYTCELPKGNYYYQTINFTDLGDGAVDYRKFIKDGYFTAGEPNAVNNTKVSNIKAYAYANMLTVKGIKVGATVMLTDLTGRIVVNTVSTSDVFTKTLKPAIYIIKVVSGNDVLRTKVIVR